MHDLIPLDPALPPRRADHGRDRRHHGLRRGGEGRWRPARPTPATGGTSPLGAPPGAPQPCRRMSASSPPIYPASLTAAARPSTIGRRAAAIGYHHKMAGHEPPTNQEAVKAVLRGIRRTIGAAKQGKAPATADV